MYASMNKSSWFPRKLPGMSVSKIHVEAIKLLNKNYAKYIVRIGDKAISR